MEIIKICKNRVRQIKKTLTFELISAIIFIEKPRGFFKNQEKNEKNKKSF